MNFAKLFEVLIIIGAVILAVKLFLEYGLSLTTLFAVPAVAVVAWFALFTLNNFALGPMQIQAQGSREQLWDLVVEIAPEVLGGDGFSGNQESGKYTGQIFGGLINGQNENQSGGGNNNYSQQQSPSIAPPAPPEEGDTRWSGDLYPPYGGLSIHQIECFQGIDLPKLYASGYLPNGTLIMMTKENGAIKRVNQEWLLEVTLPQPNTASLKFHINGVMRKEIKDALGGDSITGQDPWPQFQEVFMGGEWHYQSGTCLFP